MSSPETGGGSRLDEFSSGKSISVAPGSIEKELASMWRNLYLSAQKGERTAITRACLWNLIVRTPGGAAFTEAKKIVDDISPSLPAHVLVLSTNAAGPDAPLEAWIEANWHAGGGGSRQIGSEEVTIAASGSAVNELLPSMVRALVVSDVPTAAVWHGMSPSGDAVDGELFAAAQRAVVGVEGSEDSLRGMAAIVETSAKAAADLTSLAWLRTTAWRQLLASLFDPPTPEGELATVDGVTISCSEDNVGAALLTLGWLATRLGWKGAKRVGARIYQVTSSKGETITARIEPAASGGDDVLARVELSTPSGPYAVTRDGRGVVLETPEVARKQPRHVPSNADLWLDSLGARGHDPLFAAALRAISPLLK